VRGFGITGDARFLTPYTTGRAVQAEAAARLRQLVGGQPPLAAELSRLQQAADGWRRSFALPLIARARRAPLNGRDLGVLVQSKRAFDHLRSLFAAQNAHLAVAAARDTARLSRVRDAQDAAFVTILAIFVLAAAALALMVRSAVVRPLSRVREAARRVVEGDFDHRIEPTGPADLRRMAADVEAMRASLVAALEGARAAEQIAARQAAELDAQAAELRRSNAELEQFAYVASHDLQEPLRKIASFCQLLERRYSDKLDERGRQYIDFAVDGAKRMQNLINDLLTFSRLGRSHDVRARLPLGRPLDAAINALGAAIEESGAVIERPQSMPEVLGDPTLLTLLWQNLLGNAIKFRAPGRAPMVRISLSEEEGHWRACVTDNGIGVAPEFA
jgi:signal transduction histidine kinase